MSKKKILIAEDYATMRSAYSLIFAAHRTRHCVEVVADGSKAIALIELGEYDLVITDMSMPVLDGRGLYLRVQEVCVKESRKIPLFLFCSAVSTALDEVAEFCAGSANRRMLKPFSWSRLTQVVQEMLVNEEELASQQPDALPLSLHPW